MKNKTAAGLILLNLLVVALILIIVFLPSSMPYNIFRIILGAPLVLFIPGYALVAFFFPRQDDLDTIGRVALSFGISIISVVLIGLILNFAPIGIKPEPVLYSVSGFSFFVSTMALWRRFIIPEEERFNIDFSLKMPGWDGSSFNKCLSALLVLVILGALAMLVYIIAVPGEQEAFTEFYAMEAQDTSGYPAEFILNEGEVASVGYGKDELVYIDEACGRVILGIINNEGDESIYSIVISVDGDSVGCIDGITLTDGETWEQETGFAPLTPGDNQKVEFLLYKNSSPEADKTLHIWIDARLEQ